MVVVEAEMARLEGVRVADLKVFGDVMVRVFEQVI